MIITTNIGLTQITDKIYMGSENDSNNVEHWQSLGITAIANVASNASDPVIPPKYLHLTDQDDYTEIKPMTLYKFLKWMEETLPNHKVFIHCQMGISRVSAFTIAWFMRCGWSWDEAEAFIRAKRPQCNPAIQLKASILQFFGQ